MTIDAALEAMLTQTCDVYHRDVSTSSNLGAKYRSYPDTADITGVKWLLRPSSFIRSADRRTINLQGELDSANMTMLVADTEAIQLDDKIILKKWSDGSAMSATEQKDNSFVVVYIYEGKDWTGHKQVYLTSLSKLYNA